MNLKLKTLIFYLLLFASISVFSDYHPDSKNVLVLHSYSPSMAWVEEMNLGIKNVVDAEYGLKIEVTIEFLDAKRYNSDMYFLHMAKALKFKYESIDIHAIISCDDHAIDFLLKYRDICFPDVPIFFCGVNNTEVLKDDNYPDIRGIYEINPLEKNINLIKQLLPETETIFAVVDPNTKTSNIDRQIITDFRDQHQSGITIQLSDNFTFNELEEYLASLEANTAVLYFSYMIDSTGEYLPHVTIARRLLRRCNSPVFTMNKIYLNLNVIGGYVTDPRAHAEAATTMMIDYLRGISLNDIHENDYVSEKLFLPFFNHTYLENYKIPTKNLPENAQINDIEEYLQKDTYRKIVYLLLVIVIIGLLTIYLLIINVLARKKSKVISSENQKLLDITEIEAAMLFKFDLAGKYNYINSRVTKIFGLAIEQIIGHTSREAGFCEAHCQADEQLLNSSQTSIGDTQVEYWVENPVTGQKYYCQVRYLPIYINESLTGFSGILIDITRIKDDYEVIARKLSLYSKICNDNSIGIAVLKAKYDDNGEYIDYQLVDCNPAFNKILDISETNFKNRFLSDISYSLKDKLTEFLNNKNKLVEFSINISDSKKWLSASISFLSTDEISLNVFDLSSLKLQLDEITKSSTKTDRVNKILSRDLTDMKDKLSINQQLLIRQSQFAYTGKLFSGISIQWLNSITQLRTLIQNNKLNCHAIKDFSLISELVDDTCNSLGVFDYLFNHYNHENTVPIEELVQTSLKFFTLSRQVINIDITHKLQKSCCFKGLPHEYALVILNILSNSQDAFITNEIDQPQITINLNCDKENCKLSIIDNAGGIPYEYHQKIFSPFFSTRLEQTNSGLGLYICQKIMEKYQGKININKIDNGSEFIIETKNV